MANSVDSNIGHGIGFSEDDLALVELMLEEEGIVLEEARGIPAWEGPGDAPQSSAQRRFWIAEQIVGESGIYSIPLALYLRGSLDRDALDKSLTAIVERHHVLRSTLHMVGGRAVQRVGQPRRVTVPLVDLSDLDEAQQQATLHEHVDAEAARSFDLSRDLMIRARLLRLHATEHVLLLTVHHVAADAWSLEVLVEELTTLYTVARTQGEDALVEELPTLPVQYADYAAWEQERLTQGEAERQLAYWTTQLDGVSALPLVPEHARPAAASHAGAEVEQVLPASLHDTVEAIAREAGTTRFVVLLAGFAALLARYSGAEDIAIGTPVAGRNHPDLEGLIGCFVNTLVIRATVEPHLTFRRLVADVRDLVVEAQQHQAVPFEHVVEALAPDRDLSRTPLFQVLFNYAEPAPAAHEEGALPPTDVAIELLDAASPTAKFDLTLTATKLSQAYALGLQFRTDLIEPALARQMLAHYARLLEAGLSNPDKVLAEHPLMEPAEHAQALADSRGPIEDAHQPFRSFYGAVEARAREASDDVAVVAGSEHVTYGALWRRSRSYTHVLREQGIGVEDRVGLLLPRSVDLLAAILGVHGAGAAYVPLNKEAPVPHIASCCETADVRLIVADEHTMAIAVQAGRTLVVDDDEMDRLADDDGSAADIHPGQAAYVLFTSGSTGTPKGVVVTQGGLAHLTAALETSVYAPLERARGSKVATVGWNAPVFFDASVKQLIQVANGRRLVVLSDDERRDPGLFLRAMRRCRVDAVDGTPTLVRHLLRFSTREDTEGLELSSFLGGEAVDVALLGDLLDRFGRPQVNVYGPTETTVDATGAVLTSTDSRVVPIGAPLANTTTYVLSPTLELLPTGVAGELYIGGPGVARGYAGRPALTAARFVPDPFGHPAGGRVYRTGDRVRRRRDGVLEFLGRIDRQVKLRGFRVEPAEIEATLLSHPVIAEAAVVVRDEGGEQQLAAYVVPLGDVELSGRGLRLFLSARLPRYMVPGSVTVLDALPKTPSGKVNRRALPAPAAAVVEGPPPTAGLETELAALWGSVLESEVPSRLASFFELGGHSLLAMQVLSRVRERYGVSVGVRALFEAPTLAGFAERISEAMSLGRREAAGPLLAEAQETGVL
ncbi:MAG: amino acid adenylation domain-containing protein [Bacteroidota bacterium]